MTNICATEYYSALIRKDVLTQATTWLNHEDVQVPGVIRCIETESRSVVAWGWVAPNGGRTLGWVSLPSVQYNKFTAAGAQQLAASLRKCPHVETLA